MFTITKGALGALGALWALGASAEGFPVLGVDQGGFAPAWQWNALSGALPADGSVGYSGPALGGLIADATGVLTYKPNNLVSPSNSFTGWASLNVTLTNGGLPDPSGGSGASKIVANTTGGFHQVSAPASFIAKGVKNLLCAAQIAASGYGYAYLNCGGPIDYAVAFNLSTCSYSGYFTGGNVATSYGGYSLGNGWCELYVVAPAQANNTMSIGVLASGGNFSAGFAGNNSSGIFLFNQSFSAVTYEIIPRVGDQVFISGQYYGPAFEHDTSGNPLGLRIWEPRTNEILYSAFQSGWSTLGAGLTPNSAVAPDGTTTAARATPSSTNEIQTIYQSVSGLTSSVSYTWSVFAKPNPLHPYNYFEIVAVTGAGSAIRYAVTANIATCAAGATQEAETGSPTGKGYSITPAYGGYCRVAVTMNTSNTGHFWIGACSPTGTPAFDASYNPKFAGDGTSGCLVWGAGLEKGSFPEPYIPTGSTTVASSADSVTLTGAPLAVLGGTNASLVVEAATTGIGTTNALLGINSSTYYLAALASGNAKTNPTASLSATGGAVSAGANFREAVALSASKAALSLNGGAAVTGTGTSATVTDASLGSTSSSTAYLDGYVRSMAIYSKTLPNSALQSKSTGGAPF